MNGIQTSTGATAMKQNQDCRIVCVGKRRDGRLRYWCLAHHADATAKYGKRAKQCRYAHIPQISPHETLTLDPSLYGGGVAIWGAVPPLYDTTRNPTEHGVHVHARHSDSDSKVIGRHLQIREADCSLCCECQKRIYNLGTRCHLFYGFVFVWIPG